MGRNREVGDSDPKMEEDTTAEGGEESSQRRLKPMTLVEEANAIRARIEACPVHMSSVTAFASALAANISVAVDASVAFCFVRDVETEQLLGVYSARTAKGASAARMLATDKRAEAHGDAHVVAPGKQTVESRQPSELSTLQQRFMIFKTESGKYASPHPPSHPPVGGCPTDSLGPDVAELFSSLIAQDARGSDSFLRGETASSFDEDSGTALSVSVKPPPGTNEAHNETEEPAQDKDNNPPQNKAGACSLCFASFPPDLVAVSSDSFVWFLQNDLSTRAKAYAFDPETKRLSALPKDQKCDNRETEKQSDPKPLKSDKEECVLIACRLEDEGARSACVAMANARVAYVGPSSQRRPSPLHIPGTHRNSRMDGAAVTSRASGESGQSINDALRSSQTSPKLSLVPPTGPPQGPLLQPHPVLFSATLEASGAQGDDECGTRPPFVVARSRTVGPIGSSVPPSPRAALNTDISLREHQGDGGQPGQAPHLLCPGGWQFATTASILGLIFCINANRPDSQQLIEAVAEACSSPIALLLQQQWLRRDRFKRMLQLELHRTVFQETSIPIRMMQRLLALLHAAVGAEAAAFFIADTQNRNFICIGGHKKATGLSLSGSHRLLGEATRQGGKTVVFNFLPPGFNKEYDMRAHFETKHAMLIPLLNTQGNVKAAVMLLNRYKCSCERIQQLKENAETQCACNQDIRELESPPLAVDSWSAAAAPCENCLRKPVKELSYGEFLSTPPSPLDIDCSRHFIRIHEMLMRAVQCEMQHSLGGQLTNVCMAGMSLLQPMETMVSYVMGEPLRNARHGKRPLGAALAQIENFVLHDRRMMLLSLRRCASVAVTEPKSPGGVGYHTPPGPPEGHNANLLLKSCTGPTEHSSISKALRRARPTIGTNDKRRLHSIVSPRIPERPDSQNACRASLPVVNVSSLYSSSDSFDEKILFVHSSSAPNDFSFGLNDVTDGNDEIEPSAANPEAEQFSDEVLAFRMRRSASLPSLVFSATLQKYQRPFDDIRKQLSLEPYRRLDLDVWRRTADELELFFFLALEELGIMVKSEKAGLREFFGIIRDAYHTDNPYHNFYHAIHVTQMCWIFLTRYSCRDVLSPTEQLGLLLAALSHDVDHPGVNNSSLCAQQHPLAIIYNDKSVLENHHAAFAARAMMQLGLFSRNVRRDKTSPIKHSISLKDPPLTISNGGDDDVEDEGEPFNPSFAEIRRVLITCILSTDMELYRHHHEAMRKRAQMKRMTVAGPGNEFKWCYPGGEELNSEEDHTLLMTCLIHCADISNPLLPERRNVQWASLIVQEFNAQVEMERHKGLPVTVFMDARTELLRTQSQIGFLSFVVLDQFRALADLVPDAEELVLQGEKNLEDWRAAMDLLREVERRDTKGESVSSIEIPRNFTFRLKNLSFKGMNGPKCFGHLRSDKADNWRPQSLDT